MPPTNPTILNREFQHPTDGWYQIEIPGQHPNRAAGVVQVIDNKAVESIVATFNREATEYPLKHGHEFPGMLIDHEHFKHDLNKETLAYGWLMQLQNRNGIPFGKINWTATGKPIVDGGDYRFFSTEYDPEDLQVINCGQTPELVRPMRLAGLTLTNQPNNKGGAPITNRAADQPGRKVQPQIAERHGTPAPALNNWFEAVKTIYKHLLKPSNYTTSFQDAWNNCKKQHPDLYATAFYNDTAADGSAAESKAATDQVTNLANRVREASGKDFNSSWNFVRSNLPRVFNRQFTKSGSVLNRERESVDSRSVQSRAAKLFGRLAQTEQLSTKTPFSKSWNAITNREPTLHKLASGKCTPEEVFAQEPELRARLA